MSLKLPEYSGDDQMINKTLLSTYDTMRKGSWGKHMDGSWEDPAKDIVKVIRPITNGCKNLNPIGSLLFSRVTKIPVK